MTAPAHASALTGLDWFMIGVYFSISSSRGVGGEPTWYRG
jgi:hypothetical protein